MKNDENLDPTNRFLLIIINRLKYLQIGDHYLISEREYVTKNPAMGSV